MAKTKISDESNNADKFKAPDLPVKLNTEGFRVDWRKEAKQYPYDKIPYGNFHNTEALKEWRLLSSYVKNTRGIYEYVNWFDPCYPLGISDKTLKVLCPTDLFTKHLEGAYNFTIQNYLRGNKTLEAVDFITYSHAIGYNGGL